MQAFVRGTPNLPAPSEKGLDAVIAYDKLVRDRIPEIIRESGRECECRVLGAEEYRQRLDEKLAEELQEYRESGEMAELADLAEVLYAIVQARGLTPEQFEQIRLAKRQERGGFEQRLLLVGVSR